MAVIIIIMVETTVIGFRIIPDLIIMVGVIAGQTTIIITEVEAVTAGLMETMAIRVAIPMAVLIREVGLTRVVDIRAVQPGRTEGNFS